MAPECQSNGYRASASLSDGRGPFTRVSVGDRYLESQPSNEVADGGWTDLEISTFLRRVAVLTKGIGEMEAERLAQRMLYRDRPESGDDRRICLECAHFAKGKCRRRIDAVRTLLQRCDSFALRGGPP